MMLFQLQEPVKQISAHMNIEAYSIQGCYFQVLPADSVSKSLLTLDFHVNFTIVTKIIVQSKTIK